MISRIWHGYTSLQDAAAYEKLLVTEIFQTIESKKIAGYRGIQLLKRELEGDPKDVVESVKGNWQEGMKGYDTLC